MTTRQQDRIQAATRLADYWIGEDPQSKVFLIHPTANDGPLKLLHVTNNTPPTGSVEAFGFRPTKEIAFSTHIAEVTPEEYLRIKENTITLPQGWTLEGSEELPANAAD